MFDDSGCGAVIGDGRSGVRLNRLSGANEVGYPTLVEVRAGPFTGSITDCTVGDYGKFLDELDRLYEQLSGSATLGGYEGFSLTLTTQGVRGSIGVAVVATAEHVPTIRLSFEFGIDQSYLPGIIRSIRSEFPPPYRVPLAARL